MPTQIDFYLLPTDNEAQKWLFACRLTNKVYALGKQIFMLTDNEQQTRKLDQLLWTWSPGSFTPHQNCLDGEQPEGPIYVSHLAPPAGYADVLLNMTDRQPECMNQFQRLLEFVGNSEKDKQSARSRYKIYRDLGVEPKTVRIESL